MTPEQFVSVANLFAEAALLTTSEGIIRAGNRRFLGLGFSTTSIVGKPLSLLAVNPADEVQAYLRTCARNREPMLGALELKTNSGETIVCRCDGARVDQDPQSGEKQLLIRFARREISTTRFSMVNRKIDELTEEIRRRRQLQRELFSQQESWRTTLASIGDGVIVTDVDGLITFMNPVAEALTGWPQAEAVGQPLTTVFQIVNESHRRPVDNPALRALRDGTIVGLANHTILISRHGAERPIDDSAAPIREPDGRVVGAVLVFRDVSRSREAEQQQRRLAALVDSSDDAILGQSLGGRITDWNAGAERMYGMTAEEAIGQSMFSLLTPPEHQDALRHALDRVSQQSRGEHLETVRRHRDGRLVPVSVRLSPLRDAYGVVQGVSSIERDITDRKRMEGTLKFLAEASKSLASLVDLKSTLELIAQLAVPDFCDWCAVDMVDPDGRLQRLAAAHIDPAKADLPQDFYRRYPPRVDAPRGSTHTLRTGEAELVYEVTEQMLLEAAHNDEHLQILRTLNPRSFMCVPLEVQSRIFGTITFVAADSGRRYGDDDLAMAKDLAHRAAIAIENAQLYQELRQADKRKDEFLAMLAHELRNPLAPIRSGLDLLALEGDSNLETIELMQGQVEHVVRLVDDLLDVSRIMQGKVELRRETVDLASLVKRSVETVRPAMVAQQQQLTVTQASHPIWLHADPVRLVQVIENLLNNACKYTNSGGRIELLVVADDHQAKVQVRDTGIGMDRDLLPRVFDLFTQSSRSLDRAQGGLGIGLTLVQKLVELHGGEVTADSAGPGLGSTFQVLLPVVSSQSPDAKKVVVGSSLHCRSILAVDDNIGAARLLTMLLQKLGDHTVEMAHDGPTALAKATQSRPEIVLLDIGLPGMNGYEVARSLRAQPDFDTVLLVALTGYGQKEDMAKSQQAGFDLHLVKPPSIDQIREVLAHPKLARPE
ncbi:PAS domain-containing hybrid sensor histidine kinase/response regulator [Lignipirellula cremea]|uniref:histidine kinase n=1 Tax=Lignipirellula cremea TaxID=2528010 RepID=A0A518E4X8_9BACT|nr:PAS domain S-box protein [Lignipirellula cremea]QDU99142.1 Autoinducer 2 sensor kinase/phosphatase LuxQ [Lignipirellula cremea]